MIAKANDRKLLLILGCVVVVLCLVAVAWHLTVERGDYKPNPIRPKDFPEILVAPEEAESTDYFASTAPGVYVLEYVIRDPYPGTKTQDHIARRLTFHGFRRPAYDLLNPQFARSPKWRIDDMVRPDQTQSHWRSEYWVNANDEVVSLILVYSFPVGGGSAPNELHVHLIYHDRDSWMRSSVLEYRKLHPQEFEQGGGLKNKSY